MILPALFIAPVPEKGRGVYTAEDLVKGTIVEVTSLNGEAGGINVA
jgi:uncharacterized protein YunC (DUF1805 family)